MNDTKFNGTCDTCGRPMYGAAHCGGTGYGRDDLGRRHCYQCCGEHDAAHMRRHGKIVLYLTERRLPVGAGIAPENGLRAYIVTNWPGSLEIRPQTIRKSHSSAFGRRIERHDVWFRFDGAVWHGVNKGDMQILRCTRTRAKG